MFGRRARAAYIRPMDLQLDRPYLKLAVLLVSTIALFPVSDAVLHMAASMRQPSAESQDGALDRVATLLGELSAAFREDFLAIGTAPPDVLQPTFARIQARARGVLALSDAIEHRAARIDVADPAYGDFADRVGAGLASSIALHYEAVLMAGLARREEAAGRLTARRVESERLESAAVEEIEALASLARRLAHGMSAQAHRNPTGDAP